MIEFLRTTATAVIGDIQEMTFGEQRGDITTNVFSAAVLWKWRSSTGPE